MSVKSPSTFISPSIACKIFELLIVALRVLAITDFKVALEIFKSSVISTTSPLITSILEFELLSLLSTSSFKPNISSVSSS